MSATREQTAVKVNAALTPDQMAAKIRALRKRALDTDRPPAERAEANAYANRLLREAAA
jgi:hypothetical protein